MIGRLRGDLVEVIPPCLLLDVGGVGYEVEVPTPLLDVATEIGQGVVLWTHLIPREDALQLYGFASRAERALFRELLRVNGVGAKLALGLLSALPAAHLQDCLMRGDAVALTRVPGVGRKTADRLVMELRDRMGALPLAPISAEAPGTIAARGAFEEAYAALLALGYRPNEARDLLQQIDPAIQDSETLLRLALRSAFQ